MEKETEGTSVLYEHILIVVALAFIGATLWGASNYWIDIAQGNDYVENFSVRYCGERNHSVSSFATTPDSYFLKCWGLNK